MDQLQVIIKSSDRTCVIDANPDLSIDSFHSLVADEFGISRCCFSLANRCGTGWSNRSITSCCIKDIAHDGDELFIKYEVVGGIDFQHREGSKIGSGGLLSESQAAIERKERLRKLALETIDITKDPYIFKNHLGSFECRLCFTLHPNEGNYLAHTQGKRHQSNLGRRAAMEAKNSAPAPLVVKEIMKKRVIKIGRPGYKVRIRIRTYRDTFIILFPHISSLITLFIYL